MNINREELMHIAKLADLNLSEEEMTKYLQDMEDILGLANQINQVDTNQIDESIGALEQNNVFRKDEVKEFENPESLLQNAPNCENGMFHIPRVL